MPKLFQNLHVILIRRHACDFLYKHFSLSEITLSSDKNIKA